MEKIVNTGYSIAHPTKTITISRAFEKKANIVGSSKYEILLRLMGDFPTYSFVYKSNEKIEKETYGKLTYDNMRAYIKLKHKDNSPLYLSQLEQTIVLNRKRTGSYARVKQWFLSAFPAYKEDAQTLDFEVHAAGETSVA